MGEFHHEPSFTYHNMQSKLNILNHVALMLSATLRSVISIPCRDSPKLARIVAILPLTAPLLSEILLPGFSQELLQA